jgi:uncharacterized protein (TIGR02271 family)
MTHHHREGELHPDELSGEDLSRGPTPQTRHPAGHVEGRDHSERDGLRGETAGVDDLEDTTQGPTPEIRRVMRGTDERSAASGQPDRDPETRADVVGNQDPGPLATDPVRTGTGAGAAAAASGGAVGHDVSGPETDSAMTRSEEELRVGTTREEAGSARLVKTVETETVTETVPVERERAVVQREPITDANVGRALDGPAISEEEHEVVLTAEQAVADKQAVPKERVRLDTETVVEERQVSETLAKERIEVEGDIERRTE